MAGSLRGREMGLVFELVRQIKVKEGGGMYVVGRGRACNRERSNDPFS
jgi:hypothetical protein